MAQYGEQEFVRSLLADFPSLGERIAAAGGSLQAHVGEFGALTQAAKSRGDWPTYERCIQLADRMLAGADAALSAAFQPSYFDHLEFEGSRGPAAWQLLTPRLQTAWKRMDAENRRLMALPQTPRKDTRDFGRGGRGGKPKDPKTPKDPKGPRGPKGAARRGGRGRKRH